MFSSLAMSSTTPDVGGNPEAQGGIEQLAVESGDDGRIDREQISHMLQVFEQKPEKKHQMELDRIKEEHARQIAELESQEAADSRMIEQLAQASDDTRERNTGGARARETPNIRPTFRQT